MSAFTDSQINTFQAFTGVASRQECEMYLEMSGGNVEAAVGIFFGGGDSASINATASSDGNPRDNETMLPDWFTLTWGKDIQPNSLPEAWACQKLEFVSGEKPSAFGKVGLVQKQNGPCGVLAVINAVLIQVLIENKKAHFGADYAAVDEDLGAAIHKIVSKSHIAIANTLSVALWNSSASFVDEAGDNGDSTYVDRIEIHQVMLGQSSIDFFVKHIDHFKRPGGLLLVIYSCILNQGIDKINKDVHSGGGEAGSSLIYRNLCTSELVCLLLYGCANGNVGAYDMLGNKIEADERVDIGILSMDEKRHGIIVCDRLKRPKYPIYVLHGIDHFTVLFDPTMEASDTREIVSANNANDAHKFDVYHFNGLPPNGPRMAKLELSTTGIAPRAPKTRTESGNVFYTPVVGQIFDVVQANQDDKKERPKQWKTWKFEVVLALQDDKNHTLYGKGKEYTNDTLPKIFQQGEMKSDTKWRCSRCYVKRHETFAFRLNDEGTELCQHCQRKREECGWSIWLSYDELPRSWQRSCDRQYQEKIVTLLETKFPGLDVSFPDGEDAPKV
eukprot:g2621.t1